MDYQKIRAEAKKDAERIYKDNPSGSLSTNIETLLKSKGISISRIALPADVSGIIKRIGNSTTVYLNNAENSERQNFTMAHELGHFTVYEKMDTQDFNFIETRTNLITPEEEYANEFAGNILMPEEKIKEFMRNKKFSSLSEVGLPEAVAREFKVSTPAAHIRLKILKASGFFL